MNALLGRCNVGAALCILQALMFCSCEVAAQQMPPAPGQPHAATNSVTSPGDYKQQLQRLLCMATAPASPSAQDYRIGPGDLLDISVFEAPDLNRTVRVSADGEVALPLIGEVHAAGLSSRDMESVLDELLRREYMTAPHVSVFVKEMESHAMSVIGAVESPGVYQIRGSESLIEVLSMSHGLADDAGDTVIVMRRGTSASSAAANSPDPIFAAATDARASSAKPMGARPSDASQAELESVEIKLKDLLDSGNPAYNVTVNPGDVVKVPRAGIVYVVGEVHKAGGFMLKTNENISVLQALALAEGMTHTAAAKRARIIRTDSKTETRTEIPINLSRVLTGRMADPLLQPKDILFVPNSTGKAALFRGTEAALAITTGVIVYRR